MADPAPGKLEADRKGWFIRDYFPDGVAPESKILFDGAGTGTGIDFGASSFTTGIDMASATISGDDIVLSATGVLMAATSIGFEIAGTSKLAVTSTGIKLDATVTLDDDGTIADASNVMTITQNTITVVGATKINLDGPTDVTGILTIDTAGSPNDGIKINATTPTDGLEIASACGSHAINISGAQTGAGITLGSTCGTYGLNIAGACTTAGIFLSTTNKISFHDANIYMRASADGHFEIVSDDTITLSATGHGGIVFGGETDWGTGLTGYDIDGTGWDWVTQTVGHVDAGDLATACAASYNALTVTATAHSTASSFFGTWTELYFVAAVDLTGAANAAAVWGQLEGAGALTSPDSGDFIAGGYFNVKTAGLLTLTTGAAVAGVRVQAEINSTTGAGRLSAFECLKSGGADWAYGLYLADITTGINVGACTTGINFSGATTPTFISGTQNTTTTTATLEPALSFLWTNDDIYGDDGDRILGSGSTMMGFLQIGSRATPTTIKNKGSHVGLLIEQNLTGATAALNATGDYVGGIYNVLTVSTTAQTTGMIAPITNYLRIYHSGGIDHSGNFIVSRNVCYVGGDDEAYNINVGHFALVDAADTHDSESACAGVEVVMNITTAKSSGDIDCVRLSVPGTQNVDSGIFFEDDDFDYAFRFGVQTNGANGEAPAGNPAHPTTAVAGNQNGWIKVLVGTATRYIPLYVSSA